MLDSQLSVFIVLLNWNNSSDTIECIQSLAKSDYRNLTIVVIDNGSADNSVNDITSFLQKFAKSAAQEGRTVSLQEYVVGERLSSPEFNLTEDKKLIMVLSETNLGFSKGSNLGIEYATKNKADYVLLLNNDTTVESDFLHRLVTFLEDHRGYSAVSPQVRNYYKKDLVCNTGGDLKWYGARKYYHYNAPVNSLPKDEYKDISFINNCAALYRTSLFAEVGVLSEKFFFGEDDFEFSMRLAKNRKRLACCFSSIVYHKVSHTVDETFSQNSLGKIFIYYLNRFIDMRDYMNRMLWHIWRYAYLFYIFYLLKRKYNFPSKQLFTFASRLIKYSGKLNSVDKDVFDEAIKMKFE